MKLRVTFSAACNVDIRRVRGQTARSVCEAVYAFARDGSGKIEVVGDSGLVLVHGHEGFAAVDVRPDELYVHGLVSLVPVDPKQFLDDPEPPPED
jgi:hypothetical protein